MEMGKLIEAIFGSICMLAMFLVLNLGFPIMTIQTGMLAYQNFVLLHDIPVALMYLALAIYGAVVTIMTLCADYVVVASLVIYVVRWLRQ